MPFDLYIDQEGRLHMLLRGSRAPAGMKLVGQVILSLSGQTPEQFEELTGKAT